MPGDPSASFPSDGFAQFLALDRVQRAAWELRLFGSSGIPGGGPNDAALGPTVGLRDTFKQGVAQAVSSARSPIAQMTDAQVAPLWASLPQDFQGAFVQALIEAMLSPPEYGGNPGGAGWQIAHFEGDNLPLGYSLYDAATDSVIERPDAPVSTPNPGDDPDPIDAETEALIANLAEGLPGGRRFY